MDRQEAAFVVVRVEQRHLLMAMHDIDGVVDIQGDGGGRMGVAGAVDVKHGVSHADHLAQCRRIFPA
jgi:hypothetical protein